MSSVSRTAISSGYPVRIQRTIKLLSCITFYHCLCHKFLLRRVILLHKIQLISLSLRFMILSHLQTGVTGKRLGLWPIFRLLCGHLCRAKHLYHIGSFPHFYSTLCGQREGMEHYRLLKCTASYSTAESQGYWGGKRTSA